MLEKLNLKEALKRLKAIKTPFARDIAGWLKDERYEDSEIRWYEGSVDTDELFMVPDVVIVNGDLKTSRSLLDCIDVDESFLAVLGNVEVDNLVSKGTIIIEKNLTAKKLVYGDSLCDLFLDVRGEISAPVVIETGHSIEADDIHAHIVICSHNIVVRKNQDCEITDLEWDHPVLHKLFKKDAFHHEGFLDRALVSTVVEQSGDVLLFTDKESIDKAAAYDPQPDIDTCEKTWRSIADQGSWMRPEEAFTASFKEMYLKEDVSLLGHANRLLEEKMFRQSLELADFVLSKGAITSLKWRSIKVLSLIGLKELEKGETAVVELVWDMTSDAPEAFMACIHYYHTTGNKETESLLYHAGVKWCEGFKDRFDGDKATYGAAPDNLKDQFGSWYKEMIIPVLDISKCDRISQILQWFDVIGYTGFEDIRQQLTTEQARRQVLLDKLTSAADSISDEMVDQVCQFPADEYKIGEIACNIHGTFPKLAYQLYGHVLRSTGLHGPVDKNYYRLYCANNLVFMAIEALPEIREQALKLGLVWAYLNPAIFMNAGFIFFNENKYDEAIAYFRLALENGYEKKAVIFNEPAIEPLKEYETFKDLIRTYWDECYE